MNSRAFDDFICEICQIFAKNHANDLILILRKHFAELIFDLNVLTVNYEATRCHMIKNIYLNSFFFSHKSIKYKRYTLDQAGKQNAFDVLQMETISLQTHLRVNVSSYNF